MPPVSWKSFALVVALAAVLRAWGAFEIATPQDDELIHARNAASLRAWGTNSESNWAHPPLGGLLRMATISAVGDNAYGWRVDNVILGTASVALLFLVAAALFEGTAVPLLAATLLALDPSHVYASRTSFVEVPVTFFFLLFLYLALLYAERGRATLPWAGVAAGLTMATKGYFVVAILATVAYLFHRGLRRGEDRAALATDVALALVLLPVAVFLLSYALWFRRGYDLVEFARMQLDAVRSMQGFSIEEFGNRAWLEAGGTPVDWFTRPLLVGKAFPADPGQLRVLLEINNFPLRMLALPAIVATAIVGWRRRRLADALPSALFAACASLFFAVDRPMFSYSAVVVAPIAHLALARAVDLLAGWSRWTVAIRGAFLAGAAAWGLYLFPLAAARSVPAALYAPLLPLVRIVGSN